MTYSIETHEIGKRFGDVIALDRFSLRAPEGKVLGLVGPSGSGKTTALRVIAGFDRPDVGSVTIAGRPVVDDSTFVPPEKRRVGMVFQDFALFPHMTVAKNIGYGLGSDGRRARVDDVLAMIGLAGMGNRMPHELSGGEQQRVALARALAPRPAVILLDEPFSNLDGPQRERVRKEVRTILVEARATAIFVTHDRDEALALSDEMAVMRDGTILQSAPPHELYNRPVDRWVASFLGDGEFVAGTAGEHLVETAFGSFPNRSAARGAVDVLIRPESVRLERDDAGTGFVVEREFYGHDQLVTLHVEGGRRLMARHGPDPIFNPGDAASWEITDVMVLPARLQAPGSRLP